MLVRRISRHLIFALLIGATWTCAPAFAETTLFEHFTLIDGTGRAPAADSAMVVIDGRISRVGPTAQLKSPPGAQVVDLMGKYVIPGLIDNHIHLAIVNGLQQDIKYYTEANAERQLRTYAAYGVTAVQILGTDKDLIFPLRAKQRAGRPDMARVFTAGQGLVYKGSYGGVAGLNKPITNAAEAVQAVDEQAAKGVDVIKLWVDDELGTLPVRMPADVSKAIIDEAHRKHLRAIAHIFYLQNAKTLLDQGVDGFAHTVRDQPVEQALIDGMKQRGVWQLAGTLSREASFTYAKLPFLDDPFFNRAVSPDLVAQLESPQRQAALTKAPGFPKYKEIFADAMRNFSTEAKAGVKYGMGTDSGPPARFPGYSVHWELSLMVQAGLTPMQALTAATSSNASFMGAKDLGTIEPTKWADFIILDANPVADIKNTRSIRAVYIAGRPVPSIWSLCVERPAGACKGTPDRP
jgi:imidazolonepropionase-like amidohydrolase